MTIDSHYRCGEQVALCKHFDSDGFNVGNGALQDLVCRHGYCVDLLSDNTNTAGADDVSGERFQGRDTSIEILQANAVLWQRWRFGKRQVTNDFRIVKFHC
ncbi:hypothetical protein D3C85_724490 [compost metagenome]